MTTALPTEPTSTAGRPLSLWRDIVGPKEHGSWSLAFEPIALGLLITPSIPGAWLALSLTAVFFARRPLRLASLEQRPSRRAAAQRSLLAFGAIAVIALAAAIATAGVVWLLWLTPTAIAGACFAWCDARGEGRAEFAELAGATAFGLTPMAFAIVADAPPAVAVSLGLLMTSRAAPSVAVVRAYLRAAKTGVQRSTFPLLATAAALLVAIVLARRDLAPGFAVVAGALFTVRALVLLIGRPAWRARTLGMLEAILGVGFVVGLAATWNS